jgi:signal transduction histidine kinase
MKAAARELRETYERALSDYARSGAEEGLLHAYELGRRAVGDGMGVLEMTALHQQALGSPGVAEQALADPPRMAGRASEFLAEALAPFELTRRGFEQLSQTLHAANKGLEDRLRAALQAEGAARDELLEGRRLEQLKNEFICVISHEVRTPLTSIHGALNLLKSGLGGQLNEQGEQLLDVAHRNSQRLVRLVTDILDLQKIESGVMTFNMQPLEVAPFLGQAVEAARGYAGQFGVRLELGPMPAGVRVRADPDRLMQVMDNLLSNAAKFSPADAVVTAAAERREGRVRFTVQDHGPGIPEEFRSRIFGRFAQAEVAGPRQGFGLGLSITKAIVEQFGGRLDYATASGEGTTFFFDLPEPPPGRAVEREGLECGSEA